MNIIVITGIGLAFLGLGTVFLFLSLRSSLSDQSTMRLMEYVGQYDDTQQTATRNFLQRSELTGSFQTRVLVPLIRLFGGIFGRFTPKKSIESIEKQLSIAGNPFKLGPREYYGLRLAATLIGLIIAYLLIKFNISKYSTTFALMGFLVCAYLPVSWLKRKVRARKNSIRRDLPDALDMLSVCAEAGLGFDQSLLRVSEEWRTDLAAEFGRVVKEMEMGFSRRQALRNLANRLEVNELSSFITVIIQSEQLGMSIAQTLYAQANQMREERRFRAQEAARKIPLKMLFPMLLFIFPAIFAVLLGPLIPVMSEFFATVQAGARLP